VQQHINLCSQLDRVVEPPFSARQQVALLIVAVVVMLGLYGFMLWSNSNLSNELKMVEAAQQKNTDELAALQAEKVKQLRDTSIESELAALVEDISFRRQLLASIKPDVSVGQNFTAHLEGLARQHIDGMWFTGIHLFDGGEQLSLAGTTVKPEYLPRYMQKLKAEDVFSGHQFRVFQMVASEERSDTLNFEVRATEAEAFP
jgi:hypothetical protein